MKKLFYFIATLLFCCANAGAQTVMWIHTSDGHSRQFQIDDIRKIYFALDDSVRSVDEFRKLSSIAGSFKLFANHPNPFNPSTRICYETTEPGMVDLRIYDVSGREVATVVCESQTPGSHQVTWDSRNSKGDKVSAGVYFYQLNLNGTADTKKMILVK